LRHSDPRLTAGTYMDTTRLETASLIEKLPDFMDEKMGDTQLDTQATVVSSPDAALAVTVNGGSETCEHVSNIDESHDLTPAVAVCHAGHSDGGSRFESPSLRHFLLGNQQMTPE
jgi:hypothetical protein